MSAKKINGSGIINETMEKYKVLIGDPFGGYSTVESGLTKKEAEKLYEEVRYDCDYFTLASIEPDNKPEVMTEKRNCIGCQIDKIDNPITPEINKRVAEAIYEDVTLYSSDLGNNEVVKVMNDGMRYEIWQPDKDAEQNDLVQEHFKIDVEYDEINNVWIASKEKAGILLVCERHSCRKSAVVLATYNFIINTKNK